jgi:hypothetical protein
VLHLLAGFLQRRANLVPFGVRQRVKAVNAVCIHASLFERAADLFHNLRHMREDVLAHHRADIDADGRQFGREAGHFGIELGPKLCHDRLEFRADLGHHRLDFLAERRELFAVEFKAEVVIAGPSAVETL